MENSGKSYFANSLIDQKEAFPTGSSRCTFTSTKLRWGESDKAEVVFFTKQEFQDIFTELLEKVEYPNPEIDFQSLSLDSYLSFWNKLYDQARRGNEGSVHDDIEAILEGMAEIAVWLDHGPRAFSTEQIASGDLKGFITDKYKARSVKEVYVESTKLLKTKNMIIYDVPGFNSTTQKHKDETVKSLKRSDAILLIKNLSSNPEVSGDEKAILTTDDDDGLKLCEKLFTIGTQSDKLNTKAEAENNIEKYRADMVKKLKVNEQRIFEASPFAYFQSIGLEDGGEKCQLLKDWGLEEQVNAVQKIKLEIENFYQTQASKNLKKRIDSTINQLVEVLHQVLAYNDCDKSRSELDKRRVSDALDLRRESAQLRKEGLKKLQSVLKEELIENRYFSITLAEEISKQIEPITIKILEERNIEVNQSATREFHIEEVNQTVRTELRKQLFERFEGLVLDIAGEKYDDLHRQILDIVLHSLKIDTVNCNYGLLKDCLSELIDDKSNGISYNRTSYVYLVERFSRDVFDILIKNPRGQKTRKLKFLEARKEFIALSTYESGFETAPILCRPLIKKVLGLSHTVSIDEIKNSLEFDGFTKELLTENIFNELVKIFLNNNLPMSLVMAYMKKKWPVTSITKFIPKEMLDKFKSKNSEFIYEEDDEVFQKVYDAIPRSESKDDLLQEINTDIESLIEVLKGPIVEALGLEKPFISTITKQIDKILDDATGKKGPLDGFIADKIDLIKYDVYSRLKQEEVDIQNKIKVVSEIKELLALIENN